MIISAEEWARESFRLTSGERRGDLIPLDKTPWMIAPLNDFNDPLLSHHVFLKCTQGGGTTVGLILAEYLLARGAGDILFNSKTNAKASEVSERLEAGASKKDWWELRDFRGTGRNPNDVTRFIGKRPDASIKFQGANPTNLQSDPAGFVINDEKWQWDGGMGAFAEKRTDSFTFKKIVDISHAGEAGSEINKEWDLCEQFNFCHLCPKCDTLIQPLMGKRSLEVYGQNVFQFDEDGIDSHRASTVRWVCPSCSHEVKESEKARREMIRPDNYMLINEGGDPARRGRKWNAFIPPAIPWSQTIARFMAAARLQAQSHYEDLRIFIIQQLVEEYTHGVGVNSESLDLPRGYNSGDDWEDGRRFTRLCMVDKQKGYYWVLIADASKGANFRVQWFGKAGSDEELEVIVQKWEVTPKNVGIDCGYMPTDVFKLCGKNGWIAYEGEDAKREGYPHTIKGKGSQGKVYKPYQVFKKMPVSQGQRKGSEAHASRKVAIKRQFSKWLIEEQLNGLLHGDDPKIEVPNEVEEFEGDFLEQIDDAVRVDEINSKTGAKKPIWKPKDPNNANNHGRDCMGQALVRAWLLGYVG